MLTLSVAAVEEQAVCGWTVMLVAFNYNDNGAMEKPSLLTRKLELFVQSCQNLVMDTVYSQFLQNSCSPTQILCIWIYYQLFRSSLITKHLCVWSILWECGCHGKFLLNHSVTVSICVRLISGRYLECSKTRLRNVSAAALHLRWMISHVHQSAYHLPFWALFWTSLSPSVASLTLAQASVPSSVTVAITTRTMAPRKGHFNYEVAKRQ